jgi:hypothetical protein
MGPSLDNTLDNARADSIIRGIVRGWPVRRGLSRLARTACSLGRPLPALLILGHMRSGSTLLVHLLLAGSELISAGERNTAYRSIGDLAALEVASRWSHRAFFRRARYAVDQINHTRFTPDAALLADSRVYPVFLVRRPEPTIRSILELTRTYYEPWPVEKAVAYYAERLRALAAQASTIPPPRALAVTYEALVGDTPATLRRLEAHLGLERPLSAAYPLQRFTQRRGDPSPRIRTGKIQPDRPRPEGSVPPESLGVASDAYQECIAALARFLPRVPPDPSAG